MVPLLKTINTNSLRNHEENNESGRRSKILIFLINMVYFALSILLLTVGILYVTGFSYDYSVTIYSTTLVAAILIVIGSLVIVLSTFNVILMNMNRQSLVFASSIIILVLFIFLLAIGIWGAVATNDQESLIEEIQYDMKQTMRYFDERSTDRYETRKINWIQTRFNCCGIRSYSDWRAFYLYGGQVFSVNYIDQWTVNNNLPYIDYVPDSCCINKHPSCGKQFYNNLNPTSFDRDRVINTRGCIYNFLTYFNKDIMFLSILSICVATVAIILWAVLAFVYVNLHMKYK